MVYFMNRLFLIFLFTFVSCHIEPIVLVHGGADNVHALRIEQRARTVKNAAVVGYKVLKKGGSVVDAVEAAVRLLEADGNFNAGKGSTLNIEGDVEMDSAIMFGFNLSSGAVTGIKNVLHPVSMARLVMDKSPHFLLAGEGAKRFARDQGVTFVPTDTLRSEHAKRELAQYLQAASRTNKYMELGEGCGGVGAIAVDGKGHVAAATSTGGRLAKLPGRVSDAALIGTGLYADDEVGAVAVTGHGEAIARYVMAHQIINGMRRGFDPGVATRNVVKGITERFHKPTGAITVSKNGQIGISFTTSNMAWAYQLRDDVHYGIDDYDHFSERIKI